MKKMLRGATLVLAAFWVCVSALAGPATGVETPSSPPQRIVSMAPSLTEVLFALGAGDRVVGVTQFCDYPPEAQNRAKVGGFFDPNYEVIVSLKPDLVILLASQDQVEAQFRRLGIRTLSVAHERVASIVDSIQIIGDAIGAGEKARGMVAELRARMDRVRMKTQGFARPLVLLSIGRNMGAGRLEDVYVAAKGSFYDDLIELAGGTNAYQGEGILYPSVSYEGILKMNPSEIVDMVGDLSKTGLTRQEVVAQWSRLGTVDAMRNGRVHVVEGTYALRPGPRFILILETFARLIHPEADWTAP